MAQQKPASINLLLNELPPGLLADTSWLQAHGLSRYVIHDLVRRGLLERLGSRLYRRATGDTNNVTRWDVAVLSAQQLNRASLHVGGPTALGLLGKSHYLSLGGESRVYLYDPAHSAPSWLHSLKLSATLLIRSRKLFSTDELGLEWRRIDLGTGRLGSQAVQPDIRQPWDNFIRLSGEERAAIEMMDEIPETIRFEDADEIFQSLTTLRPAVLMRLLAACTSVKAKRLFFFYADRHRHDWRRHVDPTTLDLGKGKRQLVRGGKLDSAYQITVPAELRPAHPEHP